jgi:hypothetical protein
MEKERPAAGFDATLLAVAEARDRPAALDLLALALGEPGRPGREALRFLLAARGSRAAALLVEWFPFLDAVGRAAVLAERRRILTDAAPLLVDLRPRWRAGLAALAAAVDPSEGVDLLLPLLEDATPSVRCAARGGFASAAIRYRAGLWTPSGPAEMRRFLSGLELALREAEPDEARALASGLVKAAVDSADARSALQTILGSTGGPAASALGSALEENGDASLAFLLLYLIAAGPAGAREQARRALLVRREPAFLKALAAEAALHMETPSGIPGPAVAALSQAAWEALEPADLSGLPAAAQRRLLWIVRSFRDDTALRARRIALFLGSRDRRIRELALDSLRGLPPGLYLDGLIPLLDDPAEELQLRSIEILRGEADPRAREALVAKARRGSERIRRAILLGAGAPLPVEAEAARQLLPSSLEAGASFSEYTFPAFRAIPAQREEAAL